VGRIIYFSGVESSSVLLDGLSCNGMEVWASTWRRAFLQDPYEGEIIMDLCNWVKMHSRSRVHPGKLVRLECHVKLLGALSG